MDPWRDATCSSPLLKEQQDICCRSSCHTVTPWVAHRPPTGATHVSMTSAGARMTGVLFRILLCPATILHWWGAGWLHWCFGQGHPRSARYELRRKIGEGSYGKVFAASCADLSLPRVSVGTAQQAECVLEVPTRVLNMLRWSQNLAQLEARTCELEARAAVHVW